MNKLTNKKISGFSLVEMIVVVACLAVIVSLSFGDMTKMFTRQMEEQERLDLEEIKKALQVYAEKEGKLPLDNSPCELEKDLPGNTTVWTVKLAKYSQMPADSMCFDQWGNKRHYISKDVVQNFRNGDYSYKVYYASVLSEGLNQQKDTPDWKNITGLFGFVNYNSSSDDILVKYNDNENKQRLYEETLSRIEYLEEALVRYERSKRYHAISTDVPAYANYIMVPKDTRSADPGNYFESSNITDLSSENSVVSIDTEINAESLTKALKIPAYYGRNAISGKNLWYISNPGPDRSLPCNGAKSTAPFYPPAIIVTTGDVRPTGC